MAVTPVSTWFRIETRRVATHRRQSSASPQCAADRDRGSPSPECRRRLGLLPPPACAGQDECVGVDRVGCQVLQDLDRRRRSGTRCPSLFSQSSPESSTNGPRDQRLPSASTATSLPRCAVTSRSLLERRHRRRRAPRTPPRASGSRRPSARDRVTVPRPGRASRAAGLCSTSS